MENGSLAFHSDERGFIVFFLRQGVRDMLQCTLTIKNHLFQTETGRGVRLWV